jgi:hypothetical protein
MRNVARGVVLGGSAILIFACVMAAPAVAELKINVPAIHPQIVSPKVVNPTPTPSFKTVVPQNSNSNLGRPSSVKADVLNSKSNPGGGNLIVIHKDADSASPLYQNAALGGGTTTGLGGSAPRLSDPSLRFTLASIAGAHRNQLDDDAPTAPPEDDGGEAASGQNQGAAGNSLGSAANAVGTTHGTGVGGAAQTLHNWWCCGGSIWGGW